VGVKIETVEEYFNFRTSQVKEIKNERKKDRKKEEK